MISCLLARRNIKPDNDDTFDAAIVAVHGITPKQVANCCSFTEVWNEFRMWLIEKVENRVVVLVAHNGKSFDFNVLAWVLRRNQLVLPGCIKLLLDTLPQMRSKNQKTSRHSVKQLIAKSRDPNAMPSKKEVPSLKLEHLYKAAFGNVYDKAHDALHDARAHSNLYSLVDPWDVWSLRKLKVGYLLWETIVSNVEQREANLLRKIDHEIHTNWMRQPSREKLVKDREYQGPPIGPTARAAELKTLLELFLVFLPVKEIISPIAEESMNRGQEDVVKQPNRRDRQPRAGDEPSQVVPRVPSLRKMTTGSIMIFFGIVLRIGLLSCRSWCSPWLTDTADRVIPVAMSRNFFLQHMRCLRLPRSKDPQLSRSAAKVMVLLETIKKGAHLLWTSGQNMAWDECILSFKGPIHFRNIISSKPHGCGIKIYFLVDELGYLVNFEFYFGKEQEVDVSQEEQSTLQRLISRLLDDNKHKHKGYIIFCDNYYTSVKMAMFLEERYGIGLIGVTKNRSSATTKKSPFSFPFHSLPEHVVKSLHQGWHRYAVTDNPDVPGAQIQCAQFKDRNKIVNFVATRHLGADAESVVARKVKGSSAKKTFKTTWAHVQYMKHYNAVDRLDRYLSEFGYIPLRCSRWTVKTTAWSLSLVAQHVWLIVNNMHVEEAPRAAYLKGLGVQRSTSTSTRAAFQRRLAWELMVEGLKQCVREGDADAERRLDELLRTEREAGEPYASSSNSVAPTFEKLPRSARCDVCAELAIQLEAKAKAFQMFGSTKCTCCQVVHCGQCLTQRCWDHTKQQLSQTAINCSRAQQWRLSTGSGNSQAPDDVTTLAANIWEKFQAPGNSFTQQQLEALMRECLKGKFKSS